MSNFSLKDHLFNPEKVRALALEIKNVHAAFESELFIQTVCEKFPEQELKQRLCWISSCLGRFLPDDFDESLSIILNALPEPCDPTLSDDDFGDFIYGPYNQFIVDKGCNERYVTQSLNALAETTTRFSAEDAIRAFINLFPELTYHYLEEWATHPHYHVRRLVSEGTRPKLPWATKIDYQQEPFLTLLDKLYSDSTRFVTRSVANHLNDVSKTDPDAVLCRLKKWEKEGRQKGKEFLFLRNHALRTLVKQGHLETLNYLGYNSSPAVDVQLELSAATLNIGDVLSFNIVITAKENVSLVVDYILHFQGKQKMTEKVFKLKTMNLKEGDIVRFSKKYHFRKDMTTRSFYPGEHFIQLQINGSQFPKKSFFLS